MKTSNKKIAQLILSSALALSLAACSNNTASTTVSSDTLVSDTSVSEEAKTVRIVDVRGEVDVPIKPKRVVALDNRSFETLDTWGIEIVGAPKDIMPRDLSYIDNANVSNIGNHREPNLELLAALDPDLVIVGQRFTNFYDDIKLLVPNAVLVDFSLDLEQEAKASSEALVNGLKDITNNLAKIFAKEEEARTLIVEFDKSIENAKKAYKAEDTILTLIVSGGNIGYAAPGQGRVWGPLYSIFDWQSAIKIDKSSADHQGDDVSLEAIAQAQADWLLVLDRDASVVSDKTYVPAKDVLENSKALANLKAIQEKHIIYAPADMYTNESIHSFIELFNSIAEAFSN